MINTILALWTVTILAHIRCFMLSDRIKDLERLTRPRTSDNQKDIGDC